MTKQVLPLRIRVNVEVMAFKEYFILSRSPELEPHHQMQFSVMPEYLFLDVVLPFFRVSPIWKTITFDSEILNT